ncbi:MAG: hypothetical protein QOE71_1617, partial [Pseudonocardiales bacterium]|nr:hypothetical protein [Pseudonocardiales bacterium]
KTRFSRIVSDLGLTITAEELNK